MLGDFVGAWVPGMSIPVVSAQLAKARAHREKMALEHDWSMSVSSPRFVASLAITVLAISIYYATGLLYLGVNPGSPSTIPTEMILALPLAIMVSLYTIPEFEEPGQRTSPIMNWCGLN